MTVVQPQFRSIERSRNVLYRSRQGVTRLTASRRRLRRRKNCRLRLAVKQNKCVILNRAKYRLPICGLGILKILPINSQLPNRRTNRSELEISATPIRNDGDLLVAGIEPFAM